MFQQLNHKDARGKEEEQEIENLSENIRKENSNLTKELDMHIQEAQRVLKMLHPRINTPRYIKTKDKERILKATRERRELPTKRYP